MRPKSCTVEHFCSYENAEFDFDSLGLALISGATGSGKSTVCDFIPWCLFGQTSKEGAADSVRAWGSDQPTKVSLTVELPGDEITVNRIRGKATQNDLYFTSSTAPETQVRGKDLAETQHLLNQRLGMDFETYALSAFFSQFSDADRFFCAKAKERREVLERIADLSTAVKLGERASEARKAAKKELETLEHAQAREQGRLEQLKRQKLTSEHAAADWSSRQVDTIADLEAKSAGFEAEKAEKFAQALARLEELDAKLRPDEEFAAQLEHIKARRQEFVKIKAEQQKAFQIVTRLEASLSSADRDLAKLKSLKGQCPTCLGPADNANKAKHVEEQAELSAEIAADLKFKKKALEGLTAKLKGEADVNKAYDQAVSAQAANARLLAQFDSEGAALQAIEKAPNIYLDRLAQAKRTENPYLQQIENATREITAAEASLTAQSEAVAVTSHLIASLSTTYDLSFALRGSMLEAAVAELEAGTNASLEKYFDTVFRVSFQLEGADKLEVSIFKGDYEAAFSSLSGGERRQLVLSFWRSLSKQIMSSSGSSCSVAILDEALNGLDDELKAKAFRMLEDMTTDFSTVIVIDHAPSFQSLFTTQFTVEKQDDRSIITEGAIGVEGGQEQAA